MALALAAGLTTPVLAQAPAVDFGDDTSEWANDGECDDPRFAGTGMAVELEDADLLKDATDCRTLFEAGSIALADPGSDTAAADDSAESTGTEADVAAAPGEIDFGDDTSEWANDGECDDLRFAGTGMAAELEEADVRRDATDCRTLFDAGSIALVDTGSDAATSVAAIDFGDDSSEWARDEECDDPRFAGTAMASSLDDENILRDATDCEAAFNAGTITLAEVGADQQPDQPADQATRDMLTALASRIDFGDDSGDYPNDDECDDPDFVGSGMAAEPVSSDRMGDATDCRAAFVAGTVSLKSASALPAAFDYGTDFSSWANDGECDDWRFAGSAMAKKLNSEDVLGDASDCRALEADGLLTIKPVFQPGYALNAPFDSAGIDFGNDGSSYANDGVCDDPRFEGPGTASTLFESDRLADATDCRNAYEDGTVALREGEA
jgi:hypothetical protein